MTVFFQQQLDYIYFFYGFAFVLLAAVCLTMHRTPHRRLPWIWLGMFGLAHGLGEWLDLVAFSLGDADAFRLLRIVLMAASYVFLAEFGSRGLARLGVRSPGPWIYFPLAILSLSGYSGGLPGINATVRYAFGFSGAILASCLLLVTASRTALSGRLLRLAALITAFYAVVSGLIAPEAQFFPASAVNQSVFLSTFGFPVQLVRGSLAFLLTATVWVYYRRTRSSDVSQRARSKSIHEYRIAALMVLILGTGWIGTQQIGHVANLMMRRDLSNQTAIAAAALDSGRVSSLVTGSGSAPDENFARLKTQLGGMQEASPEIRRLKLLILSADGSARILIDSSAGSDADRTATVEPPSPGFLQAFRTGSAVTQPASTGEGSYYSGFEAIRDPLAAGTMAIIQMDVDSAHWTKVQALYRLAAIAMTLLFSLMAVGSFLTRQGWLEYANRIAISENKLSDAQKLANLGSWAYDVEADQVVCSEEMRRIMGADSCQTYEKFREFVHPDDRSVLDAAIRGAAWPRGKNESELRIQRPDGSSRNVFVRVEYQRDSRGDIINVIGTAHDITERKQMEDALRHSEQRMRLHVERTPLAIIEWDPGFHVVDWNPAAERIFGYSKQEALGRQGSFIASTRVGSLGNDFAKGMAPGRSSSQNRTKDGRIIVCDWYNTPLTTKEGEIIGYASLAEDVTERIRSEKQLRELSLTDELTGITNRRGFMALAAQQIKNAVRFRQKVVLFYADMDGLKAINDTFGHSMGDQALKDLAGIMQASFRSADIVARLGGDEFVALTLETEDQDAGTIVARLNENIATHNMKADRPYPLSISFGVTRCDPEDPASLEDMLERGDRLMYEEKLRKQRRSA